MKKKHKKPVGNLNPKIIRGGVVFDAPNKFIFPETKNEIEKKIASTFLNLISNNKSYDFDTNYDLIENSENNIDFFVKSSNSFYLELTEITPPGKMKGGFEDLPYEHNIGKHLDKTLNLILKKSAKYEGLKTDVNLLMYITDDRSLPSPTMEKLLMFMLSKSSHIFKKVYAFYPLLENDGLIIQFFPNDVKSFTPTEFETFKL